MLSMPRKLYIKLVDAARRGSPREVCGLLCGEESGDIRIVRDVYFLKNTAFSKTRFSLDPSEQLAAIRDMRMRSFVPLGCFHSHPNGSAVPSEEDRRLAYDKEASYVIVTAQGGGEVRSFRISDGEVTEEYIMIEEQLERYSRHIAIEQIGTEGQEKLLGGSALIVGAGGLGSPAALYLAAAGVGTIGIADADKVELSNLQRQIIHTARDMGRAKALSAREKMNAINPDIDVRAYEVYLDENNFADIAGEYDFILDCTDNFKSKFLINDMCIRLEKPFSHAGVLGTRGQLMTYVPHKAACLRCVFGEPPEEGVGKEYGVLGAAVGVIGSMQAMEAVKYLTGAGELLTDRLLVYDALSADIRCVRLPNTGCKVCGERRQSNENFN